MKMEKIGVVGGAIKDLKLPSNELVVSQSTNSLAVTNGTLRRSSSNGLWRNLPAKFIPIVPSQLTYNTIGAQQWIVPKGIRSISAVVVGGGGGGAGQGWSYGGAAGGGGGLCYSPEIPVEEGDEVTIFVGRGGARGGDTSSGADGETTFLSINGVNIIAAHGGGAGLYSQKSGGDGGGWSASIPNAVGNYGGNAGNVIGSAGGSGGGGAAGYSGKGGDGGDARVGSNTAGQPGVGGGGGGGEGTSSSYGSHGGGVGIYGQGANGEAGSYYTHNGNGGNGSPALIVAGRGGMGGAKQSREGNFPGGTGGHGAARIIWGEGRAYPSTNVQDM